MLALRLYLFPLFFILFLSVSDSIYGIKQESPLTSRLYAYSSYSLSIVTSEKCFSRFMIPIYTFQCLNIIQFFQTWVLRNFKVLETRSEYYTHYFHKFISVLYAPSLQISGLLIMIIALIHKEQVLRRCGLQRRVNLVAGCLQFLAFIDMMFLLTLSVNKFPFIYSEPSLRHPPALNHITVLCCTLGVVGLVKFSAPNFYVYVLFRCLDSVYILYNFITNPPMSNTFEQKDLIDALLAVGEKIYFDYSKYVLSIYLVLPSVIRLINLPVLIVIYSKFGEMKSACQDYEKTIRLTQRIRAIMNAEELPRHRHTIALNP